MCRACQRSDEENRNDENEVFDSREDEGELADIFAGGEDSRDTDDYDNDNEYEDGLYDARDDAVECEQTMKKKEESFFFNIILLCTVLVQTFFST